MQAFPVTLSQICATTLTVKCPDPGGRKGRQAKNVFGLRLSSFSVCCQPSEGSSLDTSLPGQTTRLPQSLAQYQAM